MLALGFCSITGVFMDKAAALKAATLLREKGQALTIIPAEGMQGAERTAILITARRRDVPLIRKLLLTADPKTVMTVQAMQQVTGAMFCSKRK